jgi:sugar phosphate isomerase/epimerase
LEGNLDWDKIIAACRETNVTYIVIEQDSDYVEPFESLAISFEFLKKKLG